jgi:hypothetical protein
MENFDILNILLYMILNYLGYSLIIIFKLLFIYSFPFIYHIIQLFLSNICLYLLVKIKTENIYVNSQKAKVLETKENIIGEDDPIIQFNLMPNVRCDICKIDKLPLRSHHCEICNKCVKCFDHHCWVLAGCIGENNRLLFLLFLFLQNCSLDCSLIAIIKLLNRLRNEGMRYFLTFYFSFICIFSAIFLFVFIYHAVLFLTNQTNFELFNEEQCPYILVYSFERNKYMTQKGIDLGNNYRYRPFDGGIKKNFFLFFEQLISKDKYDINWETIYYENLKNSREKKSCFDK